MSKIFIEESTLTSIGNAIRGKEGSTAVIPVTKMAERISAIETGGGGAELPDEAFNITGDCSYRFSNKGWDWFIEEYGHKVNTNNITNASYMFTNSLVTSIPFSINFNPSTESDITSMFMDNPFLTSVPIISNCNARGFDYLFSSCYTLRELPEDFSSYFKWDFQNNNTDPWSSPCTSMFMNCFSLRQAPIEFLSHLNGYTADQSTYFFQGFYMCYALDELVNLPLKYCERSWEKENWYNDAFWLAFFWCNRLKNITFALDPNTNQPYEANWINQVIDLTEYVGYANTSHNITGHNSGITDDKEVRDFSTYSQLKDDPDWWTTDPAYSRYNHDSAVATINTLPDTSLFGGENTIIFKGEAGSATDGGAINTLTEEEIAVATAKGWTVTFA